MDYLEYVLWAYFIAYPVYIYVTHTDEKQKVLNNPTSRLGVYRWTIIHLWLPTLLLFTLVYLDALNLNDIGVQWHFGIANQMGVVFLFLSSGYFLLSIRQFSNNNEAQKTFIKQIDYIIWIMPTNVKETKWFVLGVSLSAGICEELLFRGYLLHLFSEHLPVYAAILLSSIAFGLPHIYQGIVHIFRTMILGIIMALIYLATDSLILPILLHALLDVYGGALAYVATSRQQELLPLNITNKLS